MMNPQMAAAQLLSRNPSIAQNPQSMAYINAIQSGDQGKMRALAENICNSYGVPMDQARQDTMRFFGFR